MMKYLVGVFIFIGWATNTLQGQTARQQVVNIVPPKIFSLDSRGSGLFSRQHSKVLEIELPENTVSWIIRFRATSSGKIAEENIRTSDLLKQVNKSLSDTSKQIIIVSELPDAIDIGLYLLTDSIAAEDFTSWTMLDRAQYIAEYSSVESSLDVIDVQDGKYLSGKQYIGMINQAVLDEAHVILEIVAIIDEPVSAMNNWKSSELDVLQNEIENLCASIPDTVLRPSRIEKVSLCVRQILENTWDAYAFKSLNETEQMQWKNLQLLRCLEKEKFITDKEDINIMDERIIYGQWLSGDGEQLTFKSKGLMDILKKNGQTISGNWSFENNILTLQFKGYQIQQYNANRFSEKQIQWVNIKNGNILNLKKISR